jgi:hypothetical protein
LSLLSFFRGIRDNWDTKDKLNSMTESSFLETTQKYFV